MNRFLIPLSLFLVAALSCNAQNGSSAPSEGEPSSSVQVDDTSAVPTYANFVRVTGTPEELILDFGLNPQPVNEPKEPIVVDRRVIMSFYTAKRMLAALSMSVQRHEQVFGVLETDIQKRIQNRR